MNPIRRKIPRKISGKSEIASHERLPTRAMSRWFMRLVRSKKVDRGADGPTLPLNRSGMSRLVLHADEQRELSGAFTMNRLAC